MSFLRILSCIALLAWSAPGALRGMEINVVEPGPSGGSAYGARGVVRGQGETKAAAYTKAAGKLPRGAVPGTPNYTAGGHRWSCDLHYAKRSAVTGEGKNKAKAYEHAVAQLPRGATPGNPEYSKAGGRHVCKVHYTKNGRVTGYGATRSDAYADAARQLPPKAAAGNTAYTDTGSGHRWLCEIPYRQQ